LLLRAIRHISKLIVRERDPQNLLSEACNILVQTRSYSLAWVGLTEAGSKRVVPAAWVGDRSDYLDQVRITWDDTATGQGPTGTAIRTGKPWVCIDTATDPRFAPWREIALARGYASVAAVPMRHGTRTLGAVTVCSNRKDSLHEEEVTLLKELADDLAFALQDIEHEVERKAAEAERERSLQELQAALARVKLLTGLLPICANCKRIRDHQGSWSQVETYISSHSDTTFTHGICPECLHKLYPEVEKQVLGRTGQKEKQKEE
jgi:GAF domain-containing protein